MTHMFLTLTKLNYFCINHGDQRDVFEIIINVLASSFWFIWIPMLWAYGHHKYFIPSVRESSLDVRFWRLNSVLVLKGLKKHPQTRKSEPTLVKYWASFADSSPPLNRHCISVLRSLRRDGNVPSYKERPNDRENIRRWQCCLTLLIFLYKPWRQKGFSI